MNRAILIDTETNQPIDPSWTPVIRPDELETGNQRMASNNLPWRWYWLNEFKPA